MKTDYQILEEFHLDVYKLYIYICIYIAKYIAKLLKRKGKGNKRTQQTKPLYWIFKRVVSKTVKKY